MFINEWIDREEKNMPNGIFFFLKKEGNSDICYNVDEMERYYTKWN